MPEPVGYRLRQQSGLFQRNHMAGVFDHHQSRIVDAVSKLAGLHLGAEIVIPGGDHECRAADCSELIEIARTGQRRLPPKRIGTESNAHLPNAINQRIVQSALWMQ